jgi:hypothetical protein
LGHFIGRHLLLEEQEELEEHDEELESEEQLDEQEEEEHQSLTESATEDSFVTWTTGFPTTPRTLLPGMPLSDPQRSEGGSDVVSITFIVPKSKTVVAVYAMHKH